MSRVLSQSVPMPRVRVERAAARAGFAREPIITTSSRNDPNDGSKFLANAGLPDHDSVYA